MSRSNTSFAQLHKYISRDNSNLYGWGITTNLNDSKAIENEFMKNYSYIKDARGRVNLYHEVLSLPENTNLSFDEQTLILEDLAQKYIELRAKDHIVVGAIHNEDNVHIHLIVSSNKIMGNKRERMSKSELKKIQTQVEDYKNSKYVELTSHLYTKSKELSKQTQKEQEITHRRKKQTKKQKLLEDIENIISVSKTKAELESSFKAKGIELYERKGVLGVNFENKKFRLKTLKKELDVEVKNKIQELEKSVSLNQKIPKQNSEIEKTLNKYKEKWNEKKLEKTLSKQELEEYKRVKELESIQANKDDNEIDLER